MEDKDLYKLQRNNKKKTRLYKKNKNFDELAWLVKLRSVDSGTVRQAKEANPVGSTLRVLG